jgi:hypothetical protein
MPHFKAMFDRKFVGVWDLTDDEGRPKDKVVTIKSVEKGVINNGTKKDTKPILHFEGTDKGFPMNSTNCKTVAKLYGNYTEGWIGKKIVLYPTTTSFGSDTVDAIRVRPTVPKGRPGPIDTSRPIPPGMRERQEAARDKVEAAEGEPAHDADGVVSDAAEPES